MMRRLFLLLGPLALLPGCFLLETECDKVANAICTVPGEESSCRFLHAVKRDNDLAQNACKDVLPAARGYAQEPDSVLQKGRWMAASVALRAAGFVGDVTRDDRLDKAKRDVGDAARGAGEAIGDAAKRAGDSMGKAIDDLGK